MYRSTQAKYIFPVYAHTLNLLFTHPWQKQVNDAFKVYPHDYSQQGKLLSIKTKRMENLKTKSALNGEIIPIRKLGMKIPYFSSSLMTCPTLSV